MIKRLDNASRPLPKAGAKQHDITGFVSVWSRLILVAVVTLAAISAIGYAIWAIRYAQAGYYYCQMDIQTVYRGDRLGCGSDCLAVSVETIVKVSHPQDRLCPNGSPTLDRIRLGDEPPPGPVEPVLASIPSEKPETAP